MLFFINVLIIILKFMYVDGLVIIPRYNMIKRKEFLKIQPTNLAEKAFVII